MRTTQVGWVIIFILIGIVGIVSFTSDGQSLYWVFTICMAVFLLTYKLTITIDRQSVKFSMGIGLIRGEYPIQSIVKCRSVNYLPLGWGIRFRPGVMIFNVSGNKAIELELMGKKMKIWLGTDNPDILVRYIHELKMPR